MAVPVAYDLVVTGGCGFLGAHVSACAKAEGLSILVADRPGTDRSRLDSLVPGCDVVDLDVTGAPEAIAAVVKGVGAVVHCAAYGVDYRQSDLEMALRVNVLGSVQLLAAASAARVRVVHIGTSYEYGPSEKTLDESNPLMPRGIYGVSKAAGTLAMLDRAAALNTELIVMRPFGMYGPLEGAHKLVPLVMRTIGKGETLGLTPGRQIRDYVYVGDVARACIAAVKSASFPGGGIVNLASGMELELRDLVSAAASAVGGDLSLLQWGAKAYRVDEVMRTVGTAERAKTLLGWQATTSLAEGMAMTALAEGLAVKKD